SLARRQDAPLVEEGLDSRGIDAAGAAVVGDVAFGHGAVGIAAAGLRTAVGGAAAGGPAASRDLAAGPVLQLLDQFVEPEDHFLLQLLGLGPALGAIETFADDVHLAGDGAEVLFLPGLDVEQHEGSDRAVALGSADAVFEQAEEGARRVFALEGGVLAH